MPNIDTILLVDDDPVQLAILGSYFSSRGVEHIHEAVNGITALEIIEQHHDEIGLILCDLKMPEMDGIEFMRHLKDSPFEGPIAILSSADRFLIESAEKLAKIHGLNVIGTIRKPMSKDKLDALVAKVSHKVTKAPVNEQPKVNAEFLLKAIEEGQILPWYQPKTEVSTLRVVAVEALARWVHPELGIINPDIFIPLAEQQGLMEPLTMAIIDAAIRDAQIWKAAGISIKIAINVTSEILENVAFPDLFLDKVRDSGIDKSRFIFEVTEAGVLDANVRTMEVLARLRIKDIDISIDDFGTGFSNMEQLKKFPYSELKIDQAFISDGLTDTFANASVHASVTLGRELNMRLIAEGVETREQWDYVADQGIDQIQGYFIAKAMPAANFQTWYQECGGIVDIGERDLSNIDIYAPLIRKGVA